jgi:DNA-binding transcriptional MocR family regulator
MTAARSSVVPIEVARRRRIPYAQVRAHIARDTNLSVMARHLYTLLCVYANADGEARPSGTTLQGELGCSENTRKRAVNELVKAGYLEVQARTDERGRQTANLYILLDDFGIVDDAAARIPARRGTSRGATHGPPQGGATSGPLEGATHGPGRGSPMAPPEGGPPTTPPYEQPGRTARAQDLRALREAVSKKGSADGP